MTRKTGFTLVELIFVAAIVALVVILLAPFVNMAKERVRSIKCENNLRKISLGLKAYAADHDEAFPGELKELYPKYVTENAIFDCPDSKRTGAPEAPDYRYIAGLRALSPAKAVVVEDIDGNHGKRGRHVLMVDGSIDWAR